MSILDLQQLLINLDNHEARLRRLETQEIGIATIGGFSLIEERTPSNVSETVFSNIPGTFRHLHLRWITKQLEIAGAVQMGFQFNGDSTANQYVHSNHTVRKNLGDSGEGHFISSGPINLIRDGGITGSDVDVPADEFSYGYAYIPYYITDKWKVIFGRSGGWRVTPILNVDHVMFAGRWKGTAAITSITVSIFLGFPTPLFAGGTKIALYGI